MNDNFPKNIAWLNYNILKDLRASQKLRVINTNQIELDNRWLQSSRRALSGDSRKDILNIIEKSFDTLRHSDPMFTDLEQKTLIHLQTVLKKTYPTFYELHGPDGLIHTLLSRSRAFEAQRKAHEIIKEYSVITTNNQEKFPDIFEPYPENIQQIQEIQQTNQQINQQNPMHTINLDDDIENRKCCFCAKRTK